MKNHNLQLPKLPRLLMLAAGFLMLTITTHSWASIQTPTTGNQFAVFATVTANNDPGDPVPPYAFGGTIGFIVGQPTSAGFFGLSSFTLIDVDGTCITCESLNLGNVSFDSANSLLAGTVSGSYHKNSTLRNFTLDLTDPQATFNWSRTGGSISPKILSGTYTTAPVPLPAAFWLMGSGLIGLLGIGKVKKKPN